MLLSLALRPNYISQITHYLNIIVFRLRAFFSFGVDSLDIFRYFLLFMFYFVVISFDTCVYLFAMHTFEDSCALGSGSGTNEPLLSLCNMGPDMGIHGWVAVDVGGVPLITLTYKLSQTCSSRDTPGRSTRGPCKVRGNLHSIARIKVEVVT